MRSALSLRALTCFEIKERNLRASGGRDSGVERRTNCSTAWGRCLKRKRALLLDGAQGNINELLLVAFSALFERPRREAEAFLA